METRTIVLPGEIVGKTKEVRAGHGTYVEGEDIISKFLGIKRESDNYVSVVPLSGVYVPKKGDKIIGFITNVEKFGWVVDINSPWQSFLPLSEAVDEFVDIKKVNISRFFDVGDVIYAEVANVKKGDAQLDMKSQLARKLSHGVTVKITSSKVPRLIGKSGSMVKLIKDKTNTIIRVGQNGVVWLDGEKIDKAIKAIRMVDEESHIVGLTDKVSKLLSD